MSRKFVCCRIESYESKTAQDMVRSYLDGRFENTAFCILDPTGEKRLTSSARGPVQALTGMRGSRGEHQHGEVIKELNALADHYTSKGATEETVLQDFYTFRQALNVASGDQRLLLLVVAGEDDADSIKGHLRPVMADQEIIGKFHLDFASSSTDSGWQNAIANTEEGSGLIIIRADQFGLKGTALKRLPISATSNTIKIALLEANETFAQLEERKVYSDHVAEARKNGAYFENAMPYGEDRDADGQIDSKGRGKGKGKGKGKGNRKGKG